MVKKGQSKGNPLKIQSTQEPTKKFPTNVRGMYYQDGVLYSKNGKPFGRQPDTEEHVFLDYLSKMEAYILENDDVCLLKEWFIKSYHEYGITDAGLHSLLRTYPQYRDYVDHIKSILEVRLVKGGRGEAYPMAKLVLSVAHGYSDKKEVKTESIVTHRDAKDLSTMNTEDLQGSVHERLNRQV